MVHWIQFDWIYYAITKRTIIPFVYQTCGAFVIRFCIGFVSAIVNSNVKDETVKSLGILGELIGNVLLFKKVLINHDYLQRVN